MKNIIIIDVETTGVDPYTNLITDLAASHYCDGKLVSSYTSEVQQQPRENTIMSLGAMKYSDKTFSELRSQGKAEQLVVFELADWLLNTAKQADERLTICGHNVAFDINFLKILFAKYTINGWDEIFSYKVQDTGTLALSMVAAGILPPSSCSLEKLAKTLNITDYGKLHTAQADVDLTAKVYFKLIDLLGELNDKA